VDQTKAILTYRIFTATCTNEPIKRLSSAAIFSGKRQYPSRQILWKKLIVPPKSYPLIAIIAPPNQTMTKTISKSKVLSSAFVAADRTLLKFDIKVNLRGQHQTEEEWSPQVPVSDFFSLLSCVCHWFNRIYHNPKFLPDSLQVSFLRSSQKYYKHLL